MDNYYQRNMDRFECNVNKGVQYNQLLDLTYDEGSSAPTEPVTLEEAKNFCKIDIDEDDALITELITAARQMCEDYTNIGFISRTVTAIFNNGNGGFYLPLGPIGEIDSTVDADGIEIDATITGNTWKQVQLPLSERMGVTYTGGYEQLPQKLKTALLNAVMYLYDNRSQGVENIGPIATILLKPIRRVW